MASVNKRSWATDGVKKTAWVVRYMLEGVRKQETFDKKRDADACLERIKREIQDGMHIPRLNKKTVREVCDLYLRACDDRVASGTMGGRYPYAIKSMLKNYVYPMLGEKLFCDISVLEVESWWQTLGSAKISNKTRYGYGTMVRTIELFALRRKLVTRRTFSDFLEEAKAPQKTKVRTFTQDEISQLLSAADQREKGERGRGFCMRRCYVHLALFCGLRLGEIGGLKLDDVDFEKSVIRVRHNLQDRIFRLPNPLKGPKTKAGNRDVPIPAHLLLLLEKWVSAYFVPTAHNLMFAMPVLRRNPFKPDSGQTSGLPMDQGRFHMLHWRPLLRRAGLEDAADRFHFHALRHFNASWLILNGLALTDVAGLLGHHKIDITLQTYAHSVVGVDRRRADVERAANRLLAQPLAQA